MENENLENDVIFSVEQETTAPIEVAPIEVSPNETYELCVITKITFKQIFENLIYQNIKQLNNISINIKPEVRNYFIYLCKERGDFFSHVEKTLKKLIVNNKININDVCLLMELVMQAYNNIKIDKDERKNAEPIDIIKTLFVILIMLYIQTNNLDYECLSSEIIKIIDMSIELIKVKPIKTSVPEKMSKMFLL